MKLATRISFFFIVALAVVLIGFSGSIYWLVRAHLFYQLDDHTESALNALNALVETGPGGLEWEGFERRPAIAASNSSEPILWAVVDSRGKQIDGSADKEFPSVLSNVRNDGSGRQQADVNWKSESWRVARRELRFDGDRRGSKSLSPDEEAKANSYSSLTMMVGIPFDPLTHQLRMLGTALAGLSGLVWLVSAFFGRLLCRNALSPLTRITNSISSISATDLDQRLSATQTGDELEELSRAFNGLLDRLQISFERQGRFAGEASHQLRTPLTAMLGQVDVALRRERSADEYRRALVSVSDQANRLRQIVEMLLFLTREEPDAALPDIEPLEVKDWLTEHLLTWQGHPRFRDLELDAASSTQLWIRSHQALLSQVVDNLLDNACKYSDPGSKIVVRIGQRENQVQLEVEDSGHGIPEHEVARVLDPFFRSLDAQRRGIQGAGLGLSIAQRIVAAFGGQLQAESSFGVGSRFTVIFPLVEMERLRSA